MNDGTSRLAKGNAEQIRKVIHRSVLTQQEIAARLGVRRQTVGRWAKTGDASFDHLEALADLLNTPLSPLLSQYGRELYEARPADRALVVDQHMLIQRQRETPRLPEIARCDCTYVPVASWDNLHEHTTLTRSPVLCSPQAFALVVDTDSMRPAINRGETIIVDPEFRPENGQYVLAYLGPTESPVLRRYTAEGDTVVLDAINQSWPTQPTLLSDEDHIVGTVLWKSQELI